MDSRGNIIRLQDTSPTALAKDVTYSYDALGRLLSASYASGANYSFAYDALGNITHTNTHGAYAYTSELPHAVTQV
ncbi:RHS repeat protein [bacterium]|nr:RHS repeat protein [bacterium]